MTEQQILMGLRQSDSDTIRYVYKKLAPPIFKFVLNNKGTEEDARDVFQECFVKVLSKLNDDQYEHQNKFEAYFIQVARNTWMDQLRKQKRQRYVQNDDYLLSQADDSDADALAHLLVHDRRMQVLSEVWQAWSDTDCQRRLHAFHFEQASTRQLAQIESVSLGTLLKRLFDCRKKLFKLVAQQLDNHKDFNHL
jgi:RNA polymerase sigma factor (sigma-70 family)